MIKVDLDDSRWNGVTNGLTNGQTDNAISRVAFATENYNKYNFGLNWLQMA